MEFVFVLTASVVKVGVLLLALELLVVVGGPAGFCAVELVSVLELPMEDSLLVIVLNFRSG